MDTLNLYLDALNSICTAYNVTMYIKIGDCITNLITLKKDNSEAFQELYDKTKDIHPLTLQNEYFPVLEKTYDYSCNIYIKNNRSICYYTFKLQDYEMSIITQVLELKNEDIDYNGFSLGKLVNTLLTIILINEEKISSLNALSETLKSLALNNSLLSCPITITNNSFLTKLQNNIDNKSDFRLVHIELEDFKFYEENYGLETTHDLIRKIDSSMQLLINKTHSIYKPAKNEYCILWEDFKQSDFTVFFKRLLSITSDIVIQNINFPCYYNIGIVASKDTFNAKDALTKAHVALIRAKYTKENTWIEYTEDIKQELEQKLDLERNLVKALENKELEVYYQPKVNPITDTIIGFEALLRWIKPDGSSIPPNIFIPIAEDSDLIIDIGLYVLKSVCDTLNRWEEKGLNLVKVSINISVKQLQSENFLSSINKEILLSGVDSKYLDFEITETVLMTKKEEVIEKIKDMQKKGITISLDDFGTGYSSLSILQYLPANYLKLDKSFIDDITNINSLVPDIISMAHKLNLRVIAEGVEDITQLEILKYLKCDEIQGYVYSKPVDKEAAEKLLCEGVIKV